MTFIVAAMEKERDAILKNLPHRQVAVSGIGKVNVAATVQQIIDRWKPCRILLVGCSGALNREMPIGSIVVGSAFEYWDVNCGAPNSIGQVQGMPMTFHPDAEMVRDVTGMLDAAGVRYQSLPFYSGDWVEPHPLTTMLKGKHAAIDMESAAAAQVCHRESVPFASVRVISDRCNAAEYNAFWNGETADRFVFCRAFEKL